MQDSFDSQYSTAASFSYNIADRTTDSRNITNVRMQYEDFLRHNRDRLPKNLVQGLKKQIKAMFEKQYEHDHHSSSRREQTSSVRSRREQQQVVPQRDANTQLEVHDAPMHMIGQPALRRSQSQDLERPINRHSSQPRLVRLSQPHQQPRLIPNRLDSSAIMAPHQESVNSRLVNIPSSHQGAIQPHPRSMIRSSSNEHALQRFSQSVQVNSVDLQLFQRQGEARLKRVPIKGRFCNRCIESFITPHATYNQRKQEQPQKEEAPVPLQRQYSPHHFLANRRNTLTTEEIERYHSKNSQTLKKQRLVIERH